MRLFTFVLRKSANLKLNPSDATVKNGFVRRAFGKYLLVTNTLSSGILMGLGDYCQQRIEIYQATTEKKPFDVTRSVNMSTVGLGHGVFHHFFYGWIDRTFPGTSLRNVVRKIFLDQLIASPACMYIFFIGMAIMERRGYDSGWQEIKNKFLFCYMVDWIVWPPNQFINFYFLPPKYRVIYINTLTMIYDIFLSYIKFYDQIDHSTK